MTNTIQIFGRGSLHDYSNLLASSLEATVHEVVGRLQDWNVDELLSESSESVAARLIESGLVSCPRLLVDEIWQKPAEEVSQRYHDFGELVTRRVPRFVLVVPFEGERVVFTLRARTSSTNPPRVLKLEQHELHLVVDNPPDDAAAIRANFDEQIATIERYLSWSRVEIEQHNQRLNAEVPAMVANRKDQLAATHRLQADTGYPTARPSKDSR